MSARLLIYQYIMSATILHSLMSNNFIIHYFLYFTWCVTRKFCVFFFQFIEKWRIVWKNVNNERQKRIGAFLSNAEEKTWRIHREARELSDKLLTSKNRIVVQRRVPVVSSQPAIPMQIITNNASPIIKQTILISFQHSCSYGQMTPKTLFSIRRWTIILQ